MLTFAQMLTGAGLFGVGLSVHFVWWLVRRPKDDIAGLVLCLVALPAAMMLAFAAVTRPPLRTLILDGLTIIVFVVSLASFYIITYTGAQAASPSMLITLCLAERGKEGMTEEELRSTLDASSLCDDTLHRLIDERFACLEGDQLRPVTRGLWLMKVTRGWRGLLGLPEGEG